MKENAKAKPKLKPLILTIFLLILTSAGFATNTNRNTSPAFTTNSIHAISLIHNSQCRRHGITNWEQKLASDPRFVGEELGTALTPAFTTVNSAINVWDRMAARAMEAQTFRIMPLEQQSPRLRLLTDERGFGKTGGESADVDLEGTGILWNTLPDDVLVLAEQHLSDSGVTVLGSYRAEAGKLNYIQKAQARGASYFDVGDASWQDLVSRGIEWDANRHFLDVITSRGDDVFLSIPKTEIQPGTYLSREVEYLVNEKNYRWINQWKLVAP